MFFDDTDWGAEPFVQEKQPTNKTSELSRFLGALSEAEKNFIEELVREFSGGRVSFYCKPIGTKNHVTVSAKQEETLSWINWMLNKRRKETDSLNVKYARAAYDPNNVKYKEVITDSGTIFWHMSEENNS